VDVGRAPGWLAALAARPDGEQPQPAEESIALCSTLAGRLADDHAAGLIHGDGLPPVLRAPELLAGAPATPSADVYALAAGLWTMLAGRPPHVLPGEEDVAAAALAQRRAEPPGDLADLPVPLTSLLQRALARDPAERPPDAQALRAALDDCADLVVYARRREWGDRLRPRPVVTRSDSSAAPVDDPVPGPAPATDPVPTKGPPAPAVRRRPAVLSAALSTLAVLVALAALAAVLVLTAPGGSGIP
jgi:serine/threonine-protein kinase